MKNINSKSFVSELTTAVLVTMLAACGGGKPTDPNEAREGKEAPKGA